MVELHIIIGKKFGISAILKTGATSSCSHGSRQHCFTVRLAGAAVSRLYCAMTPRVNQFRCITYRGRLLSVFQVQFQVKYFNVFFLTFSDLFCAFYYFIGLLGQLIIVFFLFILQRDRSNVIKYNKMILDFQT